MGLKAGGQRTTHTHTLGYEWAADHSQVTRAASELSCARCQAPGENNLRVLRPRSGEAGQEGRHRQ